MDGATRPSTATRTYAPRVRIRPALAALLLVACAGGDERPLPAPPPNGFDPAVTVTFEGAPPLKAEVARTPEQRARGLMQRTEVPAGTGMVFLFAGRTDVGFWMKGTLVPLSIAYVDGGTVVSTAEMTPCAKDPCPSYRPTASYTWAVEAAAGFFPSHGVGPGTRVTLSGPTAPPE